MPRGQAGVIELVMSSEDHVAVRRKSSYRKQRADAAPRVQRSPSQERSKQRWEIILSAVETLLETVNIEDLTHAEIAAATGVSRASVHYHFPTVSSLQFQIGRRYDARLAVVMQRLREEAGERPIASWHDWMRIEAVAAHAWFNAHRPACEALLGPLLTRENRVAGMEDNARVGSSKLQNLCRLFIVPNPAALEPIFQYQVEMTDLFWSASYQRRGFIDDSALEEAIRATIGYLRNFLPDVLPRREASDAAPATDGVVVTDS